MHYVNYRYSDDITFDRLNVEHVIDEECILVFIIALTMSTNDGNPYEVGSRRHNVP